MGRPDRSLHPDVFAALKAEVLRAAVELSDEQLMDLTDALHGMKRLRRPGPADQPRCGMAGRGEVAVSDMRRATTPDAAGGEPGTRMVFDLVTAGGMSPLPAHQPCSST